MGVTFFLFKDKKIKVTRSNKVSYRDKEIGNRAYELLKDIKEENNWTREMDNFFKEHNIKYEEANENEFKVFVKKLKSITVRIPRQGEISISK